MESLITGVIGQAYMDMRDYDPQKKRYGQNDVSKSDYKSADEFFNSEWFQELADNSGANKEDILRRVQEIRLLDKLKKTGLKRTKTD
jgi:hypothetical protein